MKARSLPLILPWPAAVLATAALLAACGSSGPSGGTGTTGGPSPRAYSAMLQFSKCMRAHGVSNFPDPSPGGGIRINLGSGLDPGSPAFRNAQGACRPNLPGGGPHAVSESQKLQVLANARCMREHGVPNFPDPIFPPGGGIMVRIGPGVDPNSPAFQHASRICGGP